MALLLAAIPITPEGRNQESISFLLGGPARRLLVLLLLGCCLRGMRKKETAMYTIMAAASGQHQENTTSHEPSAIAGASATTRQYRQMRHAVDGKSRALLVARTRSRHRTNHPHPHHDQQHCGSVPRLKSWQTSRGGVPRLSSGEQSHHILGINLINSLDNYSSATSAASVESQEEFLEDDDCSMMTLSGKERDDELLFAKETSSAYSSFRGAGAGSSSTYLCQRRQERHLEECGTAAVSDDIVSTMSRRILPAVEKVKGSAEPTMSSPGALEDLRRHRESYPQSRFSQTLTMTSPAAHRDEGVSNSNVAQSLPPPNSFDDYPVSVLYPDFAKTSKAAPRQQHPPPTSRRLIDDKSHHLPSHSTSNSKGALAPLSPATPTSVPTIFREIRDDRGHRVVAAADARTSPAVLKTAPLLLPRLASFSEVTSSNQVVQSVVEINDDGKFHPLPPPTSVCNVHNHLSYDDKKKPPVPAPFFNSARSETQRRNAPAGMKRECRRPASGLQKQAFNSDGGHYDPSYQSSAASGHSALPHQKNGLPTLSSSSCWSRGAAADDVAAKKEVKTFECACCYEVRGYSSNNNNDIEWVLCDGLEQKHRICRQCIERYLWAARETGAAIDYNYPTGDNNGIPSRCRLACFSPTDCTGLVHVSLEKLFASNPGVLQQFRLQQPRNASLTENRISTSTENVSNSQEVSAANNRSVIENPVKEAIHCLRKAMTESLTQVRVRSCPSCQRAFVKNDDGCNKIVCPNCRTTMCYCCRRVILNGYEHFVNRKGLDKTSLAICPLWTNDSIDEIRDESEMRNVLMNVANQVWEEYLVSDAA